MYITVFTLDSCEERCGSETKTQKWSMRETLSKIEWQSIQLRSNNEIYVGFSDELKQKLAAFSGDLWRFVAGSESCSDYLPSCSIDCLGRWRVLGEDKYSTMSVMYQTWGGHDMEKGIPYVVGSHSLWGVPCPIIKHTLVCSTFDVVHFIWLLIHL